MSLREQFIKALENLKTDSYGPDGLWILLYQHSNNTWFLKGRVFEYGYTTKNGQFPDNTECLLVMRAIMITDVSEMTDEQFDKGFNLRHKLSAEGGVKIRFWFGIAGGPGAEPPRN